MTYTPSRPRGRDISEIIDEIIQFQQTVVDRVASLIDRASSVVDAAGRLFGWTPGLGDAINRINSLIQTVNDLLQSFYDALREVLSKVGQPNLLRDYADNWVNDFGTPIENQQADLDHRMLPTAGAWNDGGDGAYSAYTGKVDAQRETAQQFRPLSERISEQLYEMAEAIQSFWIGIGGAVVTLIGALAVAIAKVTGIITAPAGFSFGAAAFTAFLAFARRAITQLVAFFRSASGVADSLRHEASGVRWPAMA